VLRTVSLTTGTASDKFPTLEGRPNYELAHAETLNRLTEKLSLGAQFVWYMHQY
jgi:hypothetical protein